MSETTKVKSGNNLFKILIVVLLVAVSVGGAAFGGYYIAAKQKGTTATTTTPNTHAVTEITDVEESFFEAGEFLVNLSDTNEKRFLKVKLILAYDVKYKKKLAKELTEKKDVISDCAIGVIRNKNAADVSGKGADALKKDLVEKINSVLTNGRLSHVYYSDFLIQ